MQHQRKVGTKQLFKVTAEACTNLTGLNPGQACQCVCAVVRVRVCVGLPLRLQKQSYF
jgi:hypothetical protein